MSLGPKISETVKGKLRLGTRILQARGLERVFRKSFNVGEDEKLIKAFQCHLSTSAGPIAGLLYILTEKIAFHIFKGEYFKKLLQGESPSQQTSSINMYKCISIFPESIYLL